MRKKPVPSKNPTPGMPTPEIATAAIADAHVACCPHGTHVHGPVAQGGSNADPGDSESSRPVPGRQWARFHVPTMDCASEESEIRRAVDGIAGIRALTFQLGQRTLALDAPAPAVELAVAAIRKAGFAPQPVAHDGPRHARADGGHEHEHEHEQHEHVHGADQAGIWRLGVALALAIAAELVGYLRARDPGLEGRRLGGGRRGDLAGGLRRLQEGPDRTAARPPEHQRADDRGGHRRLPDRPMARGGDGDGAVRDRRADRGARGRSGAQRDQGPARAGAGTGGGAAGRRQLVDAAGRRRSRSTPSCACAPASGCRWTAWSPRAASSIDQAPVTGESIPVDKAAGRPGVRRHHQRDAARSSSASRRWPSDSTLARIIHAVEEAQGSARADAALRRPLRGGLHAGRVRARAGRGGAGAVAAGLDLDGRRSTRRWCCWSSPALARW